MGGGKSIDLFRKSCISILIYSQYAITVTCTNRLADPEISAPGQYLEPEIGTLKEAGDLVVEDRGSLARVYIPNGSLQIGSEDLGGGRGRVTFDFAMNGGPPGDSGGSDGGSSDSDGDKKEEAAASQKKTETLSKCLGRGSVLLGTSMVSNLAGSFAVHAQTAKGRDFSVAARVMGITSPGAYATAWKVDPKFRHNNAWNAVLMATMSGIQCMNSKAKGLVLTLGISALTSMGGQFATTGRISARDLALDIFFIAAFTYPRALLSGWVDRSFFQVHSLRALLSGWVDRSFFQVHSLLVRKLELTGYYLSDQWIGGFSYGLAQHGVVALIPDAHDVILFTRQDVDSLSPGLKRRVEFIDGVR